MKNVLSLFVLVLFLLGACNNTTDNADVDNISIIPKPQFIEKQSGYFSMNAETEIFLGEGVDEKLAEYFIDYIFRASGTRLTLTEQAKNGVIALSLNTKDNDNKESYILNIDKKGISIESASSSGLFYGIQSILQMMPVEVYGKKNMDINGIRIPCCKIIDQPRFSWRGMHLDVSRHFFDVDFIKRYIDIIAMHKMNVFHWHLTDDNGWRIEIKKYPKLTEVSAWRVDREDMRWREVTPPEENEKPTYGGFYTQDEIREVIQYAADRYITIIPEIEMPGHTSEVFAAYPELSCTGEEFFVQPGVYWPNVDIFCAGKEETFTFIEDVLTEVIALFPADYVHIGGDEANKTRWEACDKCQNRILELGLENEDELQSWFIKRIEKFILVNGKKMIGWDEILEGGLAPEATVMSWRGMKGGIQAAEQGHDVIMSPTSHCYFDYYQANPDFEPEAIGGFLPLRKVYEFEPIPPQLSEEQTRFILGAQGNVWTEYIATPQHAEYMAIPRMTALAEVVWSQADQKDWNDFQTRLQDQLKRFDELGISYSKGSWKVNIQAKMEKGIYKVELTSDQFNTPIYFTIDGTEPTPASEIYKDPLSVSQSTHIRAVLFEDGKMKEYPSEKDIVFHLGLGKKATLGFAPNSHYPANGALSVIDGLRGTDSHRDGYWMGFEGTGIDTEIDLGQKTTVNSVSVGFFQNSGAWIFLPEVLEIALLDAEKDVIVQRSIEPEATMEVKGTILEEMTAEFDNVSAVYVQVRAKGMNPIPDWLEGSGNKGWLFIDEVVIR